ncbi:FMN-dependent NADH-azoreductase [Streptomyces chromofuscus]|uniref:FMN dependent NADH:quinone oxidoreductase n=1 Tax=Streptomyces chromofuscus TaxID=42881 RepID=A0A7M2T2B3_STRCW|nr:NAD(P)H-dependent oxidoreductase [Streptomyces chromofuscus]QOV42810.1 NAD(P)H-dependent oxidoreductase [Streptomyces chromofuscus]
MSYLLHLDSSSLGAASVSRQVADSFREAWTGEVVHRDLAASPVPHLSAAAVAAQHTDPAQHTAEQAAAAAVRDELVGEFLGASAYLFTVPMYNRTMPSVFKAWLDQVIIVGRTVIPSGTAPSAGRPAVLISARGGGYGPGTPNHGKDFLVPTLESVLGDPAYLGLDVTTLTPELTKAPVVPALAHLIPAHETSLANAHEQARVQAEKISQQLVA